MSDMANVLLAIYVWAPLMLLALRAVWTVLLYAAWKIGTGIEYLARKCYGLKARKAHNFNRGMKGRR